MEKRGEIFLKLFAIPLPLFVGTGHGARCTLAQLPAAVRGEVALTGEVIGQGYCQDFSLTQWEDKPGMDAWGPCPE